jgi:hypothetical protein
VAVRPRRISDIKPLLTNLAQTSHYEVKFGALPSKLMGYLSGKGVDSLFIAESAGLLCYNASLPTTNLASNSISGNFTGIQEKIAHTRMYDEISLDFYVDKNYKMIKFLECWMEFISSGSSIHDDPNNDHSTTPISPNVGNYFIRMQYPEYYKANAVKIIKFDRDYQKEIEYNFRGLYPRNISSIPVSYMNSDSLKVSASFSYDRYIAGRSNSFDQLVSGDSNNQDPTQSQVSSEDIFRKSQESYQFGVSNSAELQSSATSLSQNPLSSQANSQSLF